MKTLLTTLLAVAAISTTTSADEPKEAAGKTKKIQAKDLTLTVPADWEKAPNPSRMRLATLMVPSAEGDQEKGELTIFNFGGGGGDIASNVQRWISQFESEGRESQVVKGTAGDNEYVLTEISGTYKKPDGPPILRRTTPTPGYRMVGVILVLEGKGVYYLKLTGPDKTVKAQVDALRRSFGGDKQSETELDV